MILHDYLPSQNGYKVRLLCHHLGLQIQTKEVDIFGGENQTEAYLALSPSGSVPVLELDNGATLPESNAILSFLAEDTVYQPDDPWTRAQVARWMYWEEDFIQNGLASLRYWTLTNQLHTRGPALVRAKHASSERALHILERWLSQSIFLVGSRYTIADMSVFAYVSRADEAGFDLNKTYPAVSASIARVQHQPGFLSTVYPYHHDVYWAKQLQ